MHRDSDRRTDARTKEEQNTNTQSGADSYLAMDDGWLLTQPRSRHLLLFSLGGDESTGPPNGGNPLSRNQMPGSPEPDSLAVVDPHSAASVVCLGKGSGEQPDRASQQEARVRPPLHSAEPSFPLSADRRSQVIRWTPVHLHSVSWECRPERERREEMEGERVWKKEVHRTMMLMMRDLSNTRETKLVRCTWYEKATHSRTATSIETNAWWRGVSRSEEPQQAKGKPQKENPRRLLTGLEAFTTPYHPNTVRPV